MEKALYEELRVSPTGDRKVYCLLGRKVLQYGRQPNYTASQCQNKIRRVFSMAHTEVPTKLLILILYQASRRTLILVPTMKSHVAKRILKITSQ